MKATTFQYGNEVKRPRTMAAAPKVVAPPSKKGAGPKLGDLPMARLKAIARMKTVSLAGCFEKIDILNALRKGGVTDADAAVDAERVEQSVKAEAAAKAAGVPAVQPAFFAGVKGVAGKPPDKVIQKYSEAGRLKTEILILKKENERLATENQAMKWRLGLGALEEKQDAERDYEEAVKKRQAGIEAAQIKYAVGSRVESLQKANAPPEPEPDAKPEPPPAQEWSKPDAEAKETGLDLSGVPTPKAMAAEQMRRKLGLSKGAYVLPKPEVDPVCWEWKNGSCKNGQNCPWQHSLDPEKDQRSSQTTAPNAPAAQ